MTGGVDPPAWEAPVGKTAACGRALSAPSGAGDT
jgi:hypothetical protein